MPDTSHPSKAGKNTFAVIDVGSNSVRALAGHYTPQMVARVDVDRAIQPRLGSRIDETGGMDPGAVEDVAEFIGHFVADHGPFDEIHCIGTAACREAQNTPDLRKKLAAAGVNLQVISGQREAELTLRGALFAADIAGKGAAAPVVDVGGNSTEISRIGNADDAQIRVSSLPTGAVRLTQRALKSDPISSAELAAARRTAAELLRPHRSLLDESDLLVGAGGTAVSVGVLCDRWEVTARQLTELVETLAGMPLKRRRRAVSFDPPRAEIIVGGLVILQQVVELSPSKYIHISTGGVREGVLVEAGATDIYRACGRIGHGG